MNSNAMQNNIYGSNESKSTGNERTREKESSAMEQKNTLHLSRFSLLTRRINNIIIVL